MRRLYRRAAFHAVRPHFALQVRRQGRRFWTGRDGYAILHGEDRGALAVQELVSASGRELELLRGVMTAVGAGQANWRIPAADAARLDRIMPATASWNWTTDWCYLIVDLPGLLQAYRGLLRERAAALRNCELTVSMREHDRRQRVTIRIEDGRLELAAGGRPAGVRAELDAVQAVRLVFGGPAPHPPAKGLEHLRSLFPLPIHVPPFDHV